MKSWDFSKGFVRFLSVISYNLSKIDTYFGDLSFIGPIREYPHRIYEITNETINTVGPMGENTPNLLKKNKDNEKLNYWIKKFGFGDRLIFKQQFSNTYTIRFENNNSDKYTSIANAGFGASQVLPLIVQSLISPKNTITIAEQPEIHLNPRIQCELADLFVEMGNNGQTIIVETHSEHLLLRLRRLIAEKKIDSDKVALYFIENNAGNSTIKNINILQNGNIDGKDWPKGFFADSLKESIALATAQSKNFNKKTTEKIND
jgi:predicted ATPase